MDQETMRKCDHQAQRAVPVVKGLPKSEQKSGKYFEIVQDHLPRQTRLRVRTGSGLGV